MQELTNKGQTPNPAPAGQAAAVPQMPSQPAAPTVEATTITSPKKGCCGRKAGLILVLLIVLALAVIGLGWVSGRLAGKTETPVMEGPVEETSGMPETEDQLTVDYGKQSDSNEVAAIETDLKETSFSGIADELETIEDELTTE